MVDQIYLDKYYKQARWGPQRRSPFDLELACMADPELTPFRSTSQDVRILAGGTALFHTVFEWDVRLLAGGTALIHTVLMWII